MATPFRLRSEEGQLHLYVRNEWALTNWGLRDIVEDEARDLAERLDTAVESLLSSVQDTISEDLTVPWPSADGRKQAMPGVRVDAESIHLWYGRYEAAPVIAIPSIKIAELTG